MLSRELYALELGGRPRRAVTRGLFGAALITGLLAGQNLPGAGARLLGPVALVAHHHHSGSDGSGSSAASASSTACQPGDPLGGVTGPQRLILQNPCVTVTGIVACAARNSEDGDYHISLALDPGEQGLVTSANAVWACGGANAPLVVEVIPQSCGAPKPDNCADRVPFTTPAVPATGTHVTVSGPLVLDRDSLSGYSQWAEVHPAQSIM